MKKATQLEVWNRILVAKNNFKNMKPNFDFYKDAYLGNQKSNFTDEEIVVNYVFAVVSTMYATNFARMPRINAISDDALFDSEGHPNRFTAELWIKYLWKLIDLETEIGKAIIDGYIYGKGWTKAGYSIIQDINDDIIYNNPLCEHVPIYNIWVDPEAKHLDLRKDGCAEYVVHRIIRPLLQIRKDPRYSNTQKLKGHVDIPETIDELNIKETDDIKRVELYEVWIPRENRVITLCDELKADKALREMELPYGYMYPFTDFNCFNKPDGLFYYTGVVENMIPQQEEKNRIRTMLYEYIRRNMPRIFVEKGVFETEEDLEQAKTGLINAFIEVTNIGGIQAWKSTAFPGEAFAVGREITTEDIPAITGVSQYGMSQLPAVKRQATEAYLAQGGMQGRVDKMAGQIDKYMEIVLNKLLTISQTQLIGERLITDERGGYVSNYPVSRETLAGPLRIEIEGGSSRSLNKEMERQQVLQLAPMIAQFIASPIHHELGKTLALYFDFPNADSLFQQAPMMPEMMGTEGEQGEMPSIEQQTPLGPKEEMLRAEGAYTPKGPSFLKRIGKFISSKFGGK